MPADPFSLPRKGIPGVDLRAWYKTAGNRSPRQRHGVGNYIYASIYEDNVRAIERKALKESHKKFEYYDLDMKLAAFLADGIRRLAKYGMSYPGLGQEGAETIEEWQALLEKMAKGFESYLDEREQTKEFKEAVQLLVKWWPDLWD